MFMNETLLTKAKSRIIKKLKSLNVTENYSKLDFKPKKHDHTKVFHNSLQQLVTVEQFLIQSKEPIEVPLIVIDLCTILRNHLETEGLFRIAGNAVEQRNLMDLIDSGERLAHNSNQSPANVANLLKTFFRELTEPLIPYSFHNLLLKCVNNENNYVEAILLACLMLPTKHLNTLCSIMKFLNDVDGHSNINKMTTHNLAIVFAPTILPPKSVKTTRQTGMDMDRRIKIIEILIVNYDKIGNIPEDIMTTLGLVSGNVKPIKEKPAATRCNTPQKKRSSFTQMVGGIQRLIGRRSHDVFNMSSSSNISHRLRSTSNIFRTKRKNSFLDLRRIRNSEEVGFTSRRSTFRSVRNLPDLASGIYRAAPNSPPYQAFPSTSTAPLYSSFPYTSTPPPFN